MRIKSEVVLSNPLENASHLLLLMIKQASKLSLFLPFLFIFRPYGFGSWGYGSTGFGYHSTYVASPNIYGGYYFKG